MLTGRDSCQLCRHRRDVDGLTACGVDGLLRGVAQASGRACPRGGPEVGEPAERTAATDGRRLAMEAAARRARRAQRLAVCRQCDDYNGATCERLGGCLAGWEERLAAATGRCPHPLGNRWAAPTSV